MTPIVGLLTDFGLRDTYVAQLKAVLLAAAPEARLIDVTHEVPPGDVLAGAWLLWTAWRAFPPGAVFLCVVDPEVGTARRAVALAALGRLGVGPDNGLFGLVAERAPDLRAVELTSGELWRHPVSPVFHGRDVFAPVAAALARGRSLDDVGGPVDALCQAPHAPVDRRPDGTCVGHVIHIDRFGNVVTDIAAELLPSGAFAVRVGDALIGRHVRTYAEARESELITLVNSADHLEIALARASAAERLGITRGARVELVPVD